MRNESSVSLLKRIKITTYLFAKYEVRNEIVTSEQNIDLSKASVL